jgi:hypothetical protein
MAPQAVCPSIIPAGSALGLELVGLRNLRTSRSDSQLGGWAAFTQSEGGGLRSASGWRRTSLGRELYGGPFCHILGSAGITGTEEEMEELYAEGLATHGGPE